MDPKFLVVELDSKDQALQLVQVMLDKGYPRLMLLDDLSKHPSLTVRESMKTATSTVAINQPLSPLPSDNKPFIDNGSTSSIVASSSKKRSHVVPEDANVDQLEESPEKVIKTETIDTFENLFQNVFEKEWMDQLQMCQPEIVPIDVDSSSTVLNMGASSSSIAQPPSSESPSSSSPIASSSVLQIDDISKTKDNGRDYHECQLCGVRVKAPRSGRWNLQMHVIALHSTSRSYKCKACPYKDYRKSTMRKHCMVNHGSDLTPINISTNAMRLEWHNTMSKCFPEFAHRTGFYNV